jgi:hypothetical protein
MALIVQKFGGSSVSDIDRIRNVANRVAEYRHRGDQVVVVVSAMKGVTDNLIDMAKSLMPVPSEREMDMLLATGEQTTVALLAIALQSMDIPAASLTGAQAGIVTDSVHSKAKIRNITPKKIHAMLDAGNVNRRRVPGRDERGPHHHAGSRRLGPHGDRAGVGAQGRPLPDLHGRRRRLHQRPAHRANGEKARGSFVR